MTEIFEGEVVDDLQRDGLKIIQNQEYFKFGIDAVLLSYFFRIKKGGVAVDFGTGTGILPLLLSAKTQAGKIIGVEIDPVMADMATRSVEMNRLENRILIKNCDIKTVSLELGRHTVDAVVCNPPYFKISEGIQNPNPNKALARHEVRVTLEDIIREAQLILKPGGNLYMIHRPGRLAEMITLLHEYGLEPKEIQMISPKVHKPPNMFLIRANKGGARELRFLPHLVVYNDQGEFTREIHQIYKEVNITVFK
ncbi:MAG: hypothetical protein AVO33_05010 [delta proteobacterium ML8_F1]|nr:MAG: hypothetical protein AVO33_05010 [delta proteobacterium ML8_F1]